MGLVALLVTAARPSAAVTCSGSNPPYTDCCPVNYTPTQGTHDCFSTATATSANSDIVASIAATGAGGDDVLCAITFDYTWTQPPATPSCGNAPRTLRFCWGVCAGSSSPCGGNCVPHCEEAEYSSGTGHYQDHEFTTPFGTTADCAYCTVAIVDVEGNENCYPPGSTSCVFGQFLPCSTDCGTPIIEDRSNCISVN